MKPFVFPLSVKKLKDLGPSRLTLTTITVRILSQGPESPEHALEMKKRGKIAGDGFCSLQSFDKGLNVKDSSILDIKHKRRFHNE
jgi:hypothetical protein